MTHTIYEISKYFAGKNVVIKSVASYEEALIYKVKSQIL